MLLNRRAMLSASIGAISLGLSGCNNTRTTVVATNNGAAPISVLITGIGKTFNKKNIAPGHGVSQVYTSSTMLGTVVPVNVTVTVKGMAALPPVPLMLTIGYRNTFEVDMNGVVTGPIVQ